MTQALGNAHSDDCGSLCEDGLAYIALDSPGKVLQPPITAKSLKSDIWGFNHLILSCLLCPIKYLAEFDEDPAMWVYF